MRFWDSSSLIPLTVREETSDFYDQLLWEDPGIVVWWGTEVECVGTVAKKFREERFTSADRDETLERLGVLMNNWAEMQPTNEIRIRAERLMFLHQLRTADALQLAAALHWCSDDPRAAELVSQNKRLRIAARREGFTVLPEIATLDDAL